ncbi:MAG TPA: type VI secretion system tip protein VgrG [Cytophagaceae bacterium]
MSIPSVIPSESSLVTFSIKIDDTTPSGAYAIQSIWVSREINKIGTAKITIFDGGYTGLEDDFPAANSGLFDPGKKIEIKAGYHSTEEVIFSGIIIKQGIKLGNDNFYLSIECKEDAVKMTAVRNNSIFLDKKDSEIIKELTSKYGLSATIEATTVKHPEVVQYYCSDWDFIMMRADLNGMVVITDGDKINVKKPEIKGTAVVEVENGKSLLSINAEIDSRNQFSKVSSVGWDVSNQKIIKSNSKPVDDQNIGIESSKLSNVLGSDEYQLQTGTNVPANLLEAWSTGKLTRSKLSKINGKVKFIGSSKVLPGTLIKLTGLSKAFNGDAYVTGVEHWIEDGGWVTEAQLGINFKSYSEEMPDIEAPSASGMLAGIKGLHIGIVKKIHEDKDGQHRIQISYPTIEKDNLGVWARLATFYATKDSGAFFVPEVNDEVIVGFINEDPQQPIILGSVYSSKNAPAYTSEEKNKIKALVTKSKLTIEFEEEKKIITIKTPGENSIVLDDDQGSITILDKNNNKMEMTKDGITFDCAKDFTIKAKGKINMEATADIMQKATGNLKGEGMAVEFKGNTKFAAEGAMAEVKGSGQTVIKGGVVMIN